mmetsp:Transcript_20309/g.57189  ORF Transcript_20309/g.57189 Transcript_20309/m.57189 type:complete len:421 (+) Transcript_20309:54-1316(+)|eukprot:CAMPEP_0119118066 /NCGR_PEP_ID=MMETSP1310-20130426/5_1 /TAXON_ID=464262 /ORGANISM="Genus nov. species nov., Strain RCC2339" /LENGTH=420 /DNA_ID=CAMNT_0007107401 /DNA_START=19 /DNA_END=1281 /DNA_ORIENTATION=+
MKVVLVLAVCLLAVVSAQVSGSLDLTGEHLIDCQTLAGLTTVDTPNWRITELQVIDDVTSTWSSISIVYSDAACTDEMLRYDRRTRYVVGNQIASVDWDDTFGIYQSPTFETVRYSHRKELTVLNLEGEALIDSLCPFNTVVGGSYDLMDETCLAFFFECADSNKAEYGCVHLSADGDLIQCGRSETGSCTADDRVLSYFPDSEGNPVEAVSTTLYPTREDIMGEYKLGCDSLLGLPDNMFISEHAYWDYKTVTIVNYLWQDSDCEDRPFFSFERTMNWQLGFELTSPSDLSNFRELSTQYLHKAYRGITERGVDFLEGLCPEHNWAVTDYFDAIDLDCDPFNFGCRYWDNQEEIAVGLNDWGWLGRAANNPTGSCTSETRGTNLYLNRNEESYFVYRASASARQIAFGAVILALAAYFF